MLYLNPPYHIYKGVSLFSDHADPYQWYFLPIAPHLTQALDTVTNTLVPQFSLIKFRGTAGTGGFLNFDTDLGIEQALVEEIRDEIKRLQRLDKPPRLAPVPLLDGSVKMMLFDLQTGETPDPAAPLKFVSRITHNAKPSLYGENRAAFSAQLTQQGVTVLEKAMQGELSPIGIVYSLEFLALRPAYSVRLHVDWDRVQTHFEETFSTDILFFESSITNAVDKLIEDRVIEIEVDTFVPEGEEEAGIISRRDQAVEEVYDMITNAFFEPSLNPTKEEKDGWDKAEQFAKTISALGATGGMGGFGCFGYKKVDYKRIDKKTLNVTINERTTVKRSIYPQAHLSGLFKVLRQPGINLSRFVTEVDLDDPWFERRRVKVIPRADFIADGIASLNVNVEYDNQPKNLVFDPNTAAAELTWGSKIENGRMVPEVKTRYRVNFANVDSSERPVSLESREQVITVENLEVFPRELYSLITVPVIALNFPFERYSHVEIQGAYDDPANGIQLRDTFLLDKDNASKEWKLFTIDPALRRFRYKAIFRGVDHRDLEHPWVETDEESILIRDPFPPDKRRTLQIVPVFPWDQVDRAFVDVSYEDEDNGVFMEQGFEFDKDHTATQTFVVNLEDTTKRLVGFSVTVIFKNGNVHEIPRSFTLDRRLTVRSDMRGHHIAVIRSETVDFAARNVVDIKVEASYVDEAGGLSFNDSATLRSPDDRMNFEFDYIDPALTRFKYRVTTRFTNGLSKVSEFLESDSQQAELILTVG